MGVNNAPTGLSFEAKTEACDYHFCVSTKNIGTCSAYITIQTLSGLQGLFLLCLIFLTKYRREYQRRSAIQTADSFSRDRCWFSMGQSPHDRT